MLELAHALLGDAELAAELLERGALLAQAALPNDRALPRAELAHGLGEPARADLAVAGRGDDLLGIGSTVRQEILPVVLAALANGRVQRLVGGAQPHVHEL